MPERDSKVPTPLVENIDYYIEAGRWVFTAAYLLKRGECCESGCRHCPYARPQSTVDFKKPSR